MAVVTDIEDLRREAKRRLPAIVYSYVAGGGYEEETLARNRADLESLALMPRVTKDVSNRSLEKTLLGRKVGMPVGLAPVGALGITYPNGEVHAARAAERYGVPYCLSTLSIASIEDVAAATSQPFWLQLYLMKDRKVGEALVQRAKDAGCDAIVLSMDLHVRSQRHREQKHGLEAPPRIDIPNIYDAIVHPRWLFSMIHSKRRTFGNLIGLVKDVKDVGHVTKWLEEQFDSTISLKTVEWLRSIWPRKLLVKGLLYSGDARDCVAAGADGVVVSNHGGRQIDGVVSTAYALPAVVEAVGDMAEVLVDSGIRSGMDVLKMLSLGADGCLLGRAYVYGLAARGEDGVCKALDIIQTELDQTMALGGLTSLENIPKDFIQADPGLRSGVAYAG